jgi:hypothetical protein
MTGSTRPIREFVLVTLAGAALGTAAWALVAAASYRARPELCLTIGLAVAAIWRLVGATRSEAEPAALPPADPGSHPTGSPELYLLEHRLSWSSVDAERFELRVRPQLVRLAEERLRQRHGVDRWRQPERARGIVGEPLWLLMTGPPTVRPPTPTQLADLVARLERI